MSGKKPSIYVDSGIFIAYLKGEGRNASDVISQITRKEIVPVTSVATRLEVLECMIPPGKVEIAKKIMRPPLIQVKSVDMRVAELAHEIRNYYKQLRESGETRLRTVTQVDSIHLATAIHFNCDRMVTLDEIDKRRKRALIPLSGKVAGKYPLEITLPSAPQAALEI